MNNCIFQLLLFIAISSILSVAFAQDVAMNDMTRAKTKTTAECALQSCTDVKNCTCPILNSKGKLRDSYLASCTNNRCEYCAKFAKVCTFGSKSDPTENGQIPCCDTIGKDKVKKDIVCADTDKNDGRYRCIERCSVMISWEYGTAEKKQTCYDKDGYYVTSHPVQCSGTKLNTVVVCNDKRKYVDCGITGADCSGAIKCCKTYNCNKGKCTRTCTDRGGKCNDNRFCCLKNLEDESNCKYDKCTNKHGHI